MNGSGILWFDSPPPSNSLNLLRSFKMVERTCNIKNQDIIHTRGILFFRKSKSHFQQLCNVVYTTAFLQL